MGTPPRSGASVYMDISAEDAEGGARVTGVRENGPSAKAGLLVDDLIQTANDERITSKEKLDEVFREHKIGDKLRMKVLRGLNQLEIIVTLQSRPDAPAGEVFLGVAGEDAENGVKITAVAAGSPAVQARLEGDDIIQAIGDKPLTSYNELLEEVRSHKQGDTIKLKILRDNQSSEVDVTLTNRPAGQGGGRRQTQQPSAYAGINGEEAEGGVRLTTNAENSPAAKA